MSKSNRKYLDRFALGEYMAPVPSCQPSGEVQEKLLIHSSTPFDRKDLPGQQGASKSTGCHESQSPRHPPLTRVSQPSREQPTNPVVR